MKTSHRQLDVSDRAGHRPRCRLAVHDRSRRRRRQAANHAPDQSGLQSRTGQINTGLPDQAPSSSTDFRKMPTSAEIRAALMMPDDPTPVAWGGARAAAKQQRQQDRQPAGRWRRSDHRDTRAGGHWRPAFARRFGRQRIGRKFIQSGNSSGPGPSASPGNETTGHRPGGDVKQNQSGPIGATGQTMPAKFSARNDVLDRAPIMACTPKLSDQDRQQIYKR